MMRKFFKSFTYAFQGVIHGLTERNFKFHAVATIVVVFAGIYVEISMTEWFIVIMLIGGVLALELMNSAVERVVDLITSDQHPLAKQAKDLAAGAVLVFAIASAIIGLIIFVPKLFMQ